MNFTKLEQKVVDKRDLIEGLLRGLEVICAFDSENQQLTPSDIASKIGLSRAAARRYLLTLTHAGYVYTNGRQFWLSPKVLNLGYAYLGSARLPRVVLPFLQRLTHDLQESSNCAVLDGTQAVYIAKVQANKIAAATIDVGTRMPLHTSAAGWAMMAHLDFDAQQALLERLELTAYTAYTQTDKKQLLAQLDKVRAQGYVILENHLELGIRGVSVPVKNRRGQMVAALSISMNVASCTPAQVMSKMIPALQAAAAAMMELV